MATKKTKSSEGVEQGKKYQLREDLWVSEEEFVKMHKDLPRVPRILGGNCEACGFDAQKECPFFAKMYEEGKLRCACGASQNPSSYRQLIMMYVDEWKTFICNSEGCRRFAELKGGYLIPEVYNFFVK